MEPVWKLVIIGEINCFYNVFWNVNGFFSEYRIRQCIFGCRAKIRLFKQTYMFGGEEQQEEDERTKITKRKRLTVVPEYFRTATI